MTRRTGTQRLAYLHCRDIGHTWEERYDWQGKRAPWGTRRVLHCGFCGTERIEIVAVDGSVDSRHYVYEHGYRDVTALSKQEARIERVRELRRRNSK